MQRHVSARTVSDPLNKSASSIDNQDILRVSLFQRNGVNITLGTTLHDSTLLSSVSALHRVANPTKSAAEGRVHLL